MTKSPKLKKCVLHHDHRREGKHQMFLPSAVQALEMLEVDQQSHIQAEAPLPVVMLQEEVMDIDQQVMDFMTIAMTHMQKDHGQDTNPDPIRRTVINGNPNKKMMKNGLHKDRTHPEDQNGYRKKAALPRDAKMIIRTW